MAVKWPNPRLFYSDFGRSLSDSVTQSLTVTFIADKKGSDQLLPLRLNRPSQASQLIELKKLQIAQISPSQIMLGKLIEPTKMSKCNNSLTIRAILYFLVL